MHKIKIGKKIIAKLLRPTGRIPCARVRCLWCIRHRSREKYCHCWWLDKTIHVAQTREVAEKLEISTKTARKIIYEELGYSMVSTRWVQSDQNFRERVCHFNTITLHPILQKRSQIVGGKFCLVQPIVLSLHLQTFTSLDPRGAILGGWRREGQEVSRKKWPYWRNK